MNTNLNLFRINTTAWMQEDFILMTSLTEEQIKKIIVPIVEKERQRQEELNSDANPVYWSDLISEYDNDFLVGELIKEYPNDVIIQYQPDGIDLISI